MPKKYILSTKDQHSEFEDDGGKTYRPGLVIGSGSFARARDLPALKEGPGSQRLIVLNPRSEKFVDFKEARSKLNFFRAIHNSGDLFKDPHTTYRLILPKLPGIPYCSLGRQPLRQKINIFISCIEALIHCHKKRYVILDLKADNVLYERETMRSYMIDGGLSTQINTPISSEVFSIEDPIELKDMKQKFFHIAPECWDSGVILAQPSMDTYSLGIMMKSTLDYPMPEVLRLIEQCLRVNPDDRPALEHVKDRLGALNAPLKRRRSHMADLQPLAADEHAVASVAI